MNVVQSNVIQIQEDKIFLQNKKRKIYEKNMQNSINNSNINNKNAKNQKIFTKPLYSKNEDYFLKMKAYCKALFVIYPTIPNIINIVDGIIEKRASTSISTSSIYSGTSHTYKQIEKMIDMTERKCKLLNIFSLIKEFLSPMSLTDYEIIDLRFFRRKKISEISERLNIDERTLYRRINKVLDSTVKYCNLNMITLDYIEAMVKGEGWIKEIYKKSLEELNVNKVRGTRKK